MVEARKCVRCGTMYISDTEVCGNCQKKDGADLFKLKGFVENQGYLEGITQNELAIATGISNKNLSRFLGYDEFKGLCRNENVAASGNVENQGDILEELV